jgi:hypothetical protein
MDLNKFSISGDVLVKYNGNETIVDLPFALTTIGEWAFDGCTSMKSIRMHEGITKIEKGAFLGCTALESVDIPSSVCHIGYSAFRGCKNLASVELWDYPDECEKIIDECAFAECESLKSILLSIDLVEIGDCAFRGCNNLQAVYYLGDQEAFSWVEIGKDNECFNNATLYFYSSQKPKNKGNYWYYQKGKVIVWDNE